MSTVTALGRLVLAVTLSAVFPSANSQEQNNAASLPNQAPSVQSMNQIKRAFPNNTGLPALVVWFNKDGLSTTDLKTVQQVAAGLSKSPLGAQTSVMPLDKMPLPALKSLESKDGTTLVLPVSFQQNTDPSTLQTSLQNLKTRIETAAPTALSSSISTTGLHVRITGPVGIAADAQGLFKHADVTLLAATTLLVLVLLMLLYRSPILALVPLVAVGFAYEAISPLLGFLAKSGFIVVDAQGISIMTVLLFGAGTDYCLFLVARYRERLAADSDKHDAIRHAVGGAGGAIAMSGLTVVVSLLALLFAKYGPDHRFAIPFSVAILVMGLAGLTLAPALLAILGRVSFFPFVPRTPEMRETWLAAKGRRRRAPRQGSRERKLGSIHEWNGRLVSTRPWPVVLVTVVILGGMAYFAGQIKPTYDLLSSFPKDMPSRQGYELLAAHYSKGLLAPVQVMVDTPSNAVQVQDQLARLPFVQSVSEPQQSSVIPTRKLLTVTLKDDPYTLGAMNDIPLLQSAAEKALAGASGQPESTGASVWIGGETATQYDTQAYTNQDTKTVIPIVIGIIALLLLVYLRSIVAMVYLIGTVLLSYFSALGLGWLLLHNIMGAPAISGAIPLYAFVFLVALGEDYNIFMISRIWQTRKDTDLREAIREGVSKTSGVITSAGLILAGTFAVLASLPLQILVQFGLVTALGVLIDTFIVRPFLVPALTAVLGKWAFWPSRLKG